MNFRCWNEMAMERNDRKPKRHKQLTNARKSTKVCKERAKYHTSLTLHARV